MAYVVVVFAMINTAALLAVGWFLRDFMRDGPMFVARAIQEEVRKQDDRIEKRLQRAEGPARTDDGQEQLPTSGLRSGMPYRR